MYFSTALRTLPWQVFRIAVSALILVCAAFPDVVMRDSTFRMTDQQWGVWRYSEESQWYPVPEHHTWYTSGLNDPGGALFQSEPMMEFMRHNVQTLDSPYWNPYSAAGSLGPETMVDLKFSAFTLAYAFLGGGTRVFDILTLIGYWLGAFFVLLVVERRLRLSPLAAIAAGVFYLLNGFSAANVASNVAQSYFLAPLCIYAAFKFVERNSARRFAAMSASFALFLTFTFAPTTIASFAAIATCTLGFAICRAEGDFRRRALASGRVLLSVLGGAAVAVLALAFIYFPLIENTASTGILEAYGYRVFYPASPAAILSMFTPSHFFESYRSASPEGMAFSRNTIFHYGVVGLGLAVSALSRTKGNWLQPLALVLTAFVLLILARAFGMPGFSQVVDRIPLLGKLGEQYIWVGATIALVFLVALGTQNLLDGAVRRLPVLALAAVGSISAYLIYATFGLKEPQLEFKTLALTSAVCSGALVIVAVLVASYPGRLRLLPVLALISVLWIELVLGAKAIRFDAVDIYNNPTSEVTFLQENLDNQRSMTLGPYATAFEGGSAYQIQEVTSLNPGSLAGYVDYFREMTKGIPPESRFGEFLSLAMPQQTQRLDYYDWHKIDLLGVRYIVMPSTYTQYLEAFGEAGFPTVHVSELTTVVENPDVFPRAFATTISPATDDIALPHDLRHTDVMPLSITSYRNAAATIEGVVEEPSLVVLTDNWHPTWKAKVNGVETPILKVEGTFRGVEVPAGRVTIEMTYSPRTLPLALTVSALSWLSLAILATGFAPWRRRPRTTNPVLA